MPRHNIPISFAVQFDNPVQPPAYGAAVLLTQVTVATNEFGQAISQPAHQQIPLVPEDITPDMLTALNLKLATLGLAIGPRVVMPTTPEPTPEPTPQPTPQPTPEPTPEPEPTPVPNGPVLP